MRHHTARLTRRVAAGTATTVAAVAIGLAPLVPGAGAAAAAEGPLRGPTMVCDQGLCLVALSPLVDSDADGYSDEDEKAAGSDPYDPASRPTVLDALDLVAAGSLPSFEAHLTEVVVLPTVAADGRSLTPAWSMPARESAMSRLGLTSDLVGKAGLVDGSAVRIEAGLPSLDGGPSRSTVRVSGMPVGLVSAGGNGAIQVATYLDLVDRSRAHGRDSTGLSVENGRGGTMTLREGYVDGSSSIATVTRKGAGRMATYDGDLNTTGEHTTGAPTTTTNADGSTTTTSTDSDHYPGGGPFGEDRTTTTTTTRTTNADGTSTTSTVAVTVLSVDGEAVSQDLTVTTATYDADGNETGVSTTNVVCNGEGKDCSTVSGYENPDADSTDPAFVLTPENLERVLRLQGSTTTPGPETFVVGADGTVLSEHGPARPSVVLVDPDAAGDGHAVVFDTPDPDQTGAQPEYDPNLPSVLGAFGA